jgi:uncharacterized protein (TIGR02118 family)
MSRMRLSVFYPNTEGEKFDADYYKNVHVPLAVKTWNPASSEIDHGVGGPYLAAVHFIFDSNDAMNAALGSEGTALVQADVVNYTTLSPVMQISEIVE